MKKKTEVCVYCDLREGTTTDHVFCRKFLGMIDRGNQKLARELKNGMRRGNLRKRPRRH
jgi:hypothetical protein